MRLPLDQISLALVLKRPVLNETQGNNRCNTSQIHTIHHKKSPLKSELICGEGGIRTPGTLTSTSVFETDLFNHSSTSPFW